MRRFYYFLIIFLLGGCASTHRIGEGGRKATDKTLTDLEKKITSNPKDFQSYYKLGQWYALRGDTLAALTSLDSALSIHANFPDARFLKGELLFVRGRLKDAFEQFILLMEQDTSRVYVKKVGGTIGKLYPIHQVLESKSDDANPSYDPTGKKIVFQSNRNRNWDIFMMNRSGGDIKQLTKSSLNDEAPIFASENLIFFTRQQSAKKLLRDIYTYNLKDGTENSVIVHPADDWYPVFSDSHGYLFFVSDRELQGNTKTKIFRFSVRTREVVPVLISQLNYSSPWLHPFREELMFTVKDDDYYALYQCDFEGKGVRSLSTRAMNFGAPKYSPDGKRVIFFSKTGNNLDIFELDLQTEQVLRLTGHPESDLSPSYSPDGKKVLFYSNRRGKYQIYEMNLEQPFTRAQLLDKLRLAVRENNYY